MVELAGDAPDKERYLLLCTMSSYNYDVIGLSMNFLEIFLCLGYSPYDSFTFLFIIYVRKCTSESVSSKLC